MDFGKKVHDRCARCDGNEVFVSVRKVTIGDKSVDGVGDGGLKASTTSRALPPISFTAYPAVDVACFHWRNW